MRKIHLLKHVLGAQKNPLIDIKYVLVENTALRQSDLGF